MANILFTWEMGGNLGHLALIRSLAQVAARRGHTVSVALRDLRFAGGVLGDLRFDCFQAPFRLPGNPRPTPQCLSYAHTLEDFCFSGEGELALRIAAWRQIFDATRPDLVFYEHSPGALIASHDYAFGKIVVGNGFCNPPTTLVEGVFAPFITTRREAATMATLRLNDQRLLGVLNQGCKLAGAPLFDDLAEIYRQADHTFCATLPALDQFGARDGGVYLGAQPSFAAAQPRWPEGAGDKVFCYLQNFPAVGRLLAELCATGLNLLVYSRDIPEDVQRRAETQGRIRFSREPVNIETVSREARFVVHHGGHTTAIQCVLNGVPQLCVPTQQEQLLTALQLDRAGVGITAPYNQKTFAADIRQLQERPQFRQNARQLQQKYADFNWEHSEQKVDTALTQLLAR
tara:strand:+ start:91678 stop:92883 length:1206 start_codon:yes stop_codon:yes gene_type:complete